MIEQRLFKIGEISKQGVKICERYKKTNGVYMLRFNNACYVGSTSKGLRTRMQAHYQALRHGKGVCPDEMWCNCDYAEVYLLEIEENHIRRAIKEQLFILLLAPSLNKALAKGFQNPYSYEREEPFNLFDEEFKPAQ